MKTAGFVLKPKETFKIKELFFEIKKIFEKFNIEVLIDSVSAKSIGILGIDFNKMCERADFLVSLGGDGTLISLARRSYIYDKPILGINAGKLGFLTDISPENIESFLQKLLKKSIE
jgi:NAD+ kinase